MILCSMWRKLDRTLTWLIVQVQSTSKTKLNYQDLFDQVLSMTKTRQDNDMMDCIDVVYTKIETKLSRIIKLSMVCYQNHTGQWHDWPYMYGLHQNKTELLWLIGLGAVYDEN